MRSTRVRGGITVGETQYNADKLIRITLLILEDKIDGISISGDLFTHPYIGAISRLEEALNGIYRKHRKEQSLIYLQSRSV